MLTLQLRLDIRPRRPAFSDKAAFHLIVRRAGRALLPRPIPLNPATDQVYLVLYGTGIRGAPLSAVSVMVPGSSAPVQFAGAQQTYMGLDQVNMGPLPASLAGAGDVVAQLIASGIVANPVHITVQ